MSRPYDPVLMRRALEIARRENFVAHRGVYAAVTGPNLETRAEYRFLRTIGADVVGMSTVPEVIVAVHAGMRVLGLSIVTDLCLPDALKPANIEEIWPPPPKPSRNCGRSCWACSAQEGSVGCVKRTVNLTTGRQGCVSRTLPIAIVSPPWPGPASRRPKTARRTCRPTCSQSSSEPAPRRPDSSSPH